jgi:uncharacterized membrane protein YeiH
MLHLPIYIELGAVIAGSLSGALHGIRKGADPIGVLGIAVATGLGGGVLRDLFIGQGPPSALLDSRYLMTASAASVAALFFGASAVRWERVLTAVDAILLGLWVVIGLEKALLFQLPIAPAIFLGVITAVGGGLLRDILAGDRPSFAVPGELYVTPALVAALLYAALVVWWSIHPLIAEAAAVGVGALLRLLAIYRHWRLPPATQMPRWRR